MKKFAIILAVVAGSVSASFAGGNCGSCNNCAKHYRPGQCFTTNCGISANACAPPVCKPVCQPVCKPVCQPVCKPVCNPCR